jgi:hypothetical protein
MPQYPVVRFPVARPPGLEVLRPRKRERRWLARRCRGPGRRRAVAVRPVPIWQSAPEVMELRAHAITDGRSRCLLYLSPGEEIRPEMLRAIDLALRR